MYSKDEQIAAVEAKIGRLEAHLADARAELEQLQKQPISVTEIRHRIRSIVDTSRIDSDDTGGSLISLAKDVLQAIADGHPVPMEIAQAALQAFKGVPFTVHVEIRW